MQVLQPVKVDADIQATTDLKEVPHQLHVCFTMVHFACQNITRCMEWVGECTKAVIDNTEAVIANTERQSDSFKQQKENIREEFECFCCKLLQDLQFQVGLLADSLEYDKL